MPKRRTTILGLGALAMGSGAAFTSATFQNDAEAAADFRVVVEDELVVEPGAAFRDGGSGGDFEPDSGSDWASDRGDSSLFDEDNPLDSLEQAASMNDATNDELDIEVATGLDESNGREDIFSDFLQVSNNGNTHRNVAIGFLGEDGFGDDVTINNDQSDISPNDVRSIYEFKTNGNKVSENSFEEVEYHISLEPGETKQVDLVVDTTGFRDAIVDLAGGTDPFSEGGDFATVDLVDEVRFGTQEDDGQTEV